MQTATKEWWCDQRIQLGEAGEGLTKARQRTKARTKLKYHMIGVEVCAGMRCRMVVLERS